MKLSAALRLVKYLPFAPGQSFCLAANATMRSRYGCARAWLPTPCSLSTTIGTALPSAAAPGGAASSSALAANARERAVKRTADFLSQIGRSNQTATVGIALEAPAHNSV